MATISIFKKRLSNLSSNQLTNTKVYENIKNTERKRIMKQILDIAQNHMLSINIVHFDQNSSEISALEPIEFNSTSQQFELIHEYLKDSATIALDTVEKIIYIEDTIENTIVTISKSIVNIY